MRFLMLVVCLIFPNPAIAENYLCLSNFSMGLKWSNEKWNQVNFNISEDRFTVSQLSPLEEVDGILYTHKVGLVGKSAFGLKCWENYLTATLNCGSRSRSFQMNKSALRFQYFYGEGYIDVSEQTNPVTPSVSFGECSKL